MRSRRSSSATTFGQIRIMALGGVLLGLVYAQFGTGGAVPLTEPMRAEPAYSEAAPREVTARQGALRVIDGDTFHYNGERIRIADIDTPEIDGRCPYETRLAARATDRLGVLLGQGPFALKAADRDEDRFGRKLRIVTRGGESIGDILVAEGLARRWEGRRRSWCDGNRS